MNKKYTKLLLVCAVLAVVLISDVYKRQTYGRQDIAEGKMANVIACYKPCLLYTSRWV